MYLGVIFVFFFFSLRLIELEDDDTAGFIPKGDVGAELIELEDGDDILLVNLFVKSFEAKDLQTFVITTLAFFLHGKQNIILLLI